MKTAINGILGCVWVLGLIFAGGSIDSNFPVILQMGVGFFGLVLFTLSSIGIVYNNKERTK